MRNTGPTLAQIKACVDSVRRKIAHARVIGIRATGRWQGELSFQAADQNYRIYPCESPLQVRVALQDEEAATKVIVTELPEQELGDDVLLRLAKRRLLTIDPWQILLDHFNARSIDPRLSRHPWIPEALLERMAAEGYAPAAGGFLDADRVFPILLERGVGLAADRPDLQEILKWSLGSANVGRFRAAPQPYREAASEWLEQVAGPVVGPVLRCVQTCERPDAVPLGLALGVVFHPQAVGKLEKAAGRIERYLGGPCPAVGMIERWHAAAGEVIRLRLTDSRERRILLHRTDEILREIQAESFAWLSDLSPMGGDQRMARFAGAMAQALRSPTTEAIERVGPDWDQVERHEHLRQEPRRRLRGEMAQRLLRWLASGPEETVVGACSFAEAAHRYLATESYVDWARQTLQAGDPIPEVADAYAQLVRRVTAIREKQNRRFGELLRDWTAAGSRGTEVVPVEKVLEQIVAPVAAVSPVLVLVIDGMSAAVARELVEDVLRQGWVRLLPENRPKEALGLATIPSVTEISRTSLLCGELRRGTSSDETKGFSCAPRLLAHSRPGASPILFHKAVLQETEHGGAPMEVRREIESPQRRVVGVVINAVDDHLLKGEQLDMRWTKEDIKPLATLLHEARTAGRVVILVSDHGHVLDAGTELRAHEDGERWRSDDGQVQDDEVAIRGGRVAMPSSHRLIAPWGERVRYSIKKNGYHGGVTPQEMIVPIVVLAPETNIPNGWVEAPPCAPVWWERTVASGPGPSVVPAPVLGPKPGFLFDVEHPAPAKAKETGKKDAPTWIAVLLKSPTFELQKKLGGRAVPTDQELRRFLGVLNEHGGKLTSMALARALELPPHRVRSLLAVVQRLLNVDGFAVLQRDEASDTVELNLELLRRQFDLS